MDPMVTTLIASSAANSVSSTSTATSGGIDSMPPAWIVAFFSLGATCFTLYWIKILLEDMDVLYFLFLIFIAIPLLLVCGMVTIGATMAIFTGWN